VTILRVPYHLDEYLPDLDFPLEADREVTADLPRGGDWERLGALYSVVADAVAEAAARCPVVLSGDCTTSLGTMAGLQHAGADPGIVWFDAHGDVQTLETTASGYLGGLPLRLLVGYRPELIAAGLGLRPVAEDRVLLVGARDLDLPEVSYLRGSRIRRAEAAELDAAMLPEGPLYLHADLAVIDPGT
jgi:arginase